MRSERFEPGPSPFPGRRLRVLIEDPAVPIADAPRLLGSVDVTACSGPTDDREVCPLVAGGECPHGSFDVVVSALDPSWGAPVCGAWELTSTPVVAATDVTATDPEERLAEHVAAAVRHLARAPSVDGD